MASGSGGFLTKLIQDDLDKKKEDTLHEIGILRSAILNPDHDENVKSFAMERLLKKSPLKGKEQSNFLALMQHMTGGSGGSSGGPVGDTLASGSASVNQPPESHPGTGETTSVPPAPAITAHPSFKERHPAIATGLGILGGMLNPRAAESVLQSKIHEREAGTEQQRILERNRQLSSLKMGEEAGISKIRTGEEVAKESRQHAWELDPAHRQAIITDYRNQLDEKGITDNIAQGRILTQYDNYVREQIGQGTDEETAHRRAASRFDLTYHAPPPAKVQQRIVPDDKDRPEGTYHYEDLQPDGTWLPTSPAPRPASAKPAMETTTVRSALWVQQHLNDPDPQVAAAAKQMLARANQLAASGVPLDDATLRFLAERSLITDKDPAFGMGSAATGNRVSFFKMQAMIATENGDTPAALVATQSAVKAARTALPQIQRVFSQTKVNEGNATKNFELLKTLGQRMDNESIQVSIPLINSWMRTGQVKLGGNPAVNNFTSMLVEAMTEYAKVVTGQTTGAAVTDRARAEVQGLVDKGLSTSAINDWIENTGKPSMANRATSYQDEITGLQQVIRDAGADLTGAAPGTKPPVTPGRAQPGKINVSYGGKVYPFDTQQQADEFKRRVGIQ